MPCARTFPSSASTSVRRSALPPASASRSCRAPAAISASGGASLRARSHSVRRASRVASANGQ
jgi:hypothetical protein